MFSSTTIAVSCSDSIAALSFGAIFSTSAEFASPHDVQIHRASSSDSRLRCAPKTRMTALNVLSPGRSCLSHPRGLIGAGVKEIEKVSHG